MRCARVRAAILAIALVAPWSGAGGAVCLGTLPWLAADCPDICCDSAVACCDDERAPRPSHQGLPDCCVAAPDLWYHTGGLVSVLLAPAPAHDLLATALAPRIPLCSASTLRLLRRPPPLPLTGVVLLQV